MALAASLALHAQAVDNPAANNKADNGQRNTTENAFVFTGSADNQWSNAANWTIGTAKGEIANRIPTATDNVIIDGDCVVATSGEAASITINKGSSLTVQQNSFAVETPFTIKDGGQLFAPAGSEYRGTFEKTIRGYGDSRLGNYYFLAMPITNFNLATGFQDAGMFPNGDPNSTDYDLYFFSQSNDVAGEMDLNGDGVIDWGDEECLWLGEWQNYKWYINPESYWEVTSFTDEVPNNYAYMYANKENTTLSFNGTFYAGNQMRQCDYVGGCDWPGLQLVGNPLPCNASLTFGTRINGFYMLNEQNHRRNVVAVEGYEAIVAPATALFAEATSGNEVDRRRVTFVPSTGEANVRSAKGFVTIEVLSSDGILEDRAYVRDYESEGLSKFSLSNEGAKIYIPQNGKKYAAVSGTGATTLPLCFTTTVGGIHTLTFKVENMDCDYLHLVDNATGADIDLLRTPKYSFNANDCPYATRFKLVFAEEATNDIADNLLNRGKSKQSSNDRNSPYWDPFFLPEHGGNFNGDADFDPGEDPNDPDAPLGTEPTTLDGGYWNLPGTWEDGEVPYAVDVIINGPVTIPADYPAYAGDITFANGGSLTIEEGGQLYHTGEVMVSMELNVTGYGSGGKDSNPNNDGYRLFACPVHSTTSNNFLPVEGTNLNTGTFDLYKFDESQDLEWINYKQPDPSNPGDYTVNPNFGNLVLGWGYLYANAATVDNVVLRGYAIPTVENYALPLTLSYTTTPGVDFPGWNLVGNPYTCNAYVKDGAGYKSYYVLNGDGDGVVAEAVTVGSTNYAIAPMKGLFVKASATDQSCIFTTAAPSKSGSLNIIVNKDLNKVDNAIISFGNGGSLEKFQLNPNRTKVYMTQEGKDYAVVNAENEGEMPVSFKAEKNGSYTLSFTNDDVTFSYLHLIDNMTGADVDLLATPSYSFDARTSDYASRFKLVFATGNATEDSFAFFSNGSFIISNEGEATLQVVDVMGRILKSESINGSANVNVNAATGVYMLRLINGNDVKVQKVVVR